MDELSRAKKRIDRIYRPEKTNIYSNRFYQDLCTGYSSILRGAGEKSFLRFEPQECAVEKLFRSNNHHSIDYDIENTLRDVVGHLLRYGNAYLYLKPEYTTSNENLKNKICSVELEEIMGYPVKKYNRTIFYIKQFGGTVRKAELVSEGLIELRLKDLGFKKTYFSNMFKRLEKYSISSIASEFVSKPVEGYDFIKHNKHNQISILKKTKSIGWHFGTECLSDSYILYKTIQQYKLKLKFLDYIVDKINASLKMLLKDQNTGEIKVNTTNQDYNRLWRKYSSGEISGTELTKVLFPFH